MILSGFEFMTIQDLFCKKHEKTLLPAIDLTEYCGLTTIQLTIIGT